MSKQSSDVNLVTADWILLDSLRSAACSFHEFGEEDQKMCREFH